MDTKESKAGVDLILSLTAVDNRWIDYLSLCRKGLGQIWEQVRGKAGGISQWENTMKKAHQSQDTPVHAADIVTSLPSLFRHFNFKNELKKEEA
jgi:hypothetical protein